MKMCLPCVGLKKLYNVHTFHAVKIYSVAFVQIISLKAEIENIVEMSFINACF